MVQSKVSQHLYIRSTLNLLAFKIEIFFIGLMIFCLYPIEIQAVEIKLQSYMTAATQKAVEPFLLEVGLKAHVTQIELKKARDAYDGGEKVLARRLLTPLAMGGAAEAQYLLGVLSDQDGTPGSLRQSMNQSFIWFHAAARQGHPDAQHNLALSYARGEGVEINLNKAMQWWERAAHNGNTDSQYNLGVIYALGSDGIAQNFQRARAWWYQAATQGDVAAQYNLGALYAAKNTPLYNSCLALQWLSISAKNGFDRAHAALKSFEPRAHLEIVCSK